LISGSKMAFLAVKFAFAN